MPLTLDEIQSLLPPNFNYSYFEKIQQFPFQPAASGFQLANAAWLMDMCLLAYHNDTGFISQQLAKANLHDGLLFLGFDNAQSRTQCFVAHNQEVIIVVFRGTEVSGLDRIQNILSDIMTDAQITQGATAFGKGVHSGFAKAAGDVWEQLFAFVNSIRKQQAVWVAGHSLGGALATLTAGRFAGNSVAVQGLYSFGSPRVGDERFAENFSPPAFRIVNGDDIVTTVPILGPAKPFPIPRLYKHIGELKYIDHAGKLRDDDPRPMAEVMPMLRALLEQGLTEQLTQPLVDHAPILYSKLLWQNL
jgi:triacylglycerol lipase